MASEVTEVEPRKVPPVAVGTGSKVAAFVPTTMEEAWRLAGALAESGMTPKAYGNDRNRVMVGIMAGAEVGLTPFAALQSIAVIGNNPSLWGDGALAVVQSSGLLEDMDETDDGHAATCRLNRKGRTTPIVRSFSMDDAKKAGLAGKSGPWTQYPARMRQMRARAFALRDGFADVLKGLHIAEEVRDYAPINGGELRSEIGATPLTGAMLLAHAKSSSGGDAASDPAPQQTIAEELNDGIPVLEPEGRADTDMGEAHVEDAETAEIPAWQAASQQVWTLIQIATDKASWQAAETEFLRVSGSFPDSERLSLDNALQAKMRELDGEG